MSDPIESAKEIMEAALATGRYPMCNHVDSLDTYCGGCLTSMIAAALIATDPDRALGANLRAIFERHASVTVSIVKYETGIFRCRFGGDAPCDEETLDAAVAAAAGRGAK